VKDCPTCEQKVKRCKRCGKRWCGTSLKLRELYPDETFCDSERTYGTKKCREKGPKR